MNDEPRCSRSEQDLKFLAATLAELAEGERRGLDFLQICGGQDAWSRHLPFFERQSADESRHHATFARLIPSLPPPPPMEPAVKRFFARLDGFARTPAAIVAMHGVLETIAQGFLEGLARFWEGERVPFDRVARDEARHAAFGRRWMQRSGSLGGEDAGVAELIRALGAAFAADSGYSHLPAARQREYDAVVEPELGAAAGRLAPLLRGIGLRRSVRALEILVSP